MNMAMSMLGMSMNMMNMSSMNNMNKVKTMDLYEKLLQHNPTGRGVPKTVNKSLIEETLNLLSIDHYYSNGKGARSSKIGVLGEADRVELLGEIVHVLNAVHTNTSETVMRAYKPGELMGVGVGAIRDSKNRESCRPMLVIEGVIEGVSNNNINTNTTNTNNIVILLKGKLTTTIDRSTV